MSYISNNLILIFIKEAQIFNDLIKMTQISAYSKEVLPIS